MKLTNEQRKLIKAHWLTTQATNLDDKLDIVDEVLSAAAKEKTCEQAPRCGKTIDGDATLKLHGKAHYQNAGKKKKTCGLCGTIGHNRSKCKAV